MINFPERFWTEEDFPIPEVPKKQPISVEQAKELLVRYLHHTFRLESLLDAFTNYDIPLAAIKDPEVQDLVDQWIETFRQPEPLLGYSEENQQQLVKILKAYFK